MSVLPLPFLVIFILAVLLVGCWRQPSPDNQPTAQPSEASPVSADQQAPFTASFEIYTHGTKRVFIDAMYHNLSPDTYITAQDPSVIHVTKPGVRWSDFFATLPMELTKDCLVTGTKQTFCTGDEGQLSFFLNATEDSEVLSKAIGAGDVLVVRYE